MQRFLRLLCALMVLVGVSFASPNLSQIIASYVDQSHPGGEGLFLGPTIQGLTWADPDPLLHCSRVDSLQFKGNADGWGVVLMDCKNPQSAYMGSTSLKYLGKYDNIYDVYVIQNGVFKNAFLFTVYTPDTGQVYTISTYAFQKLIESDLAPWLLEKNK